MYLAMSGLSGEIERAGPPRGGGGPAGWMERGWTYLIEVKFQSQVVL